MQNTHLVDRDGYPIDADTNAARIASVHAHEASQRANAKIRAELPPFEVDKNHPLIAPAVARMAELEKMRVIRMANEAALVELPARLSAAELELSTFEANGPTIANVATWRAERARLVDAVAGLRMLHDELVMLARRGNY